MEEKFFEEMLQLTMDTIDEHFGGYAIQNMKNDILQRANELFFEHNPDAPRYDLVGDINGKTCPYASDLCRPVALYKLKIVTGWSLESWKNMRIEERKKQANGNNLSVTCCSECSHCHLDEEFDLYYCDLTNYTICLAVGDNREMTDTLHVRKHPTCPLQS